VPATRRTLLTHQWYRPELWKYRCGHEQYGVDDVDYKLQLQSWKEEGKQCSHLISEHGAKFTRATPIVGIEVTSIGGHIIIIWQNKDAKSKSMTRENDTPIIFLNDERKAAAFSAWLSTKVEFEGVGMKYR